MTTRHVRLALYTILFYVVDICLAYKISTLDAGGVCNDTIWLDDGPKSAAILRLTDKDVYDFWPLYCHVTFKAPVHKWSGLTGVLEEVDLRRHEDMSRHPGKNDCVDYVRVVSDTGTGLPNERQCGSWTVTGQEPLAYLGYKKALHGYCPTPQPVAHTQRCGVSELTLEVSVGMQNQHYLWEGIRWRPHRGFTFVVTAYRYSLKEDKCPSGLQSCGTTDRKGHQHHCVHQSLWCDHHINCGQTHHNLDEYSCLNHEILGGLVTVMVGPWFGAAFLLLLVLAGLLYWRRSRPSRLPHQQAAAAATASNSRDPIGSTTPLHDFNSYAESYEVSSTLSSAHHMAIQVRVVCNSGGTGYPGAPGSSLLVDLPPSYDSLFPNGPPPPSAASPRPQASSASVDITTTTTTSLLNVAPPSPHPSTSPHSTTTTTSTTTTASSSPHAIYSNTTQTSSIVIPFSALCSSLGPHATTTSTLTASAAAPDAASTSATSPSSPSATSKVATSIATSSVATSPIYATPSSSGARHVQATSPVYATPPSAATSPVTDTPCSSNAADAVASASPRKVLSPAAPPVTPSYALFSQFPKSPTAQSPQTRSPSRSSEDNVATRRIPSEATPSPPKPVPAPRPHHISLAQYVRSVRSHPHPNTGSPCASQTVSGETDTMLTYSVAKHNSSSTKLDQTASSPCDTVSEDTTQIRSPFRSTEDNIATRSIPSEAILSPPKPVSVSLHPHISLAQYVRSVRSHPHPTTGSPCAGLTVSSETDTMLAQSVAKHEDSCSTKTDQTASLACDAASNTKPTESEDTITAIEELDLPEQTAIACGENITVTEETEQPTVHSDSSFDAAHAEGALVQACPSTSFTATED